MGREDTAWSERRLGWLIVLNRHPFVMSVWVPVLFSCVVDAFFFRYEDQKNEKQKVYRALSLRFEE
jgi:hypothetical protein